MKGRTETYVHCVSRARAGAGAGGGGGDPKPALRSSRQSHDNRSNSSPRLCVVPLAKSSVLIHRPSDAVVCVSFLVSRTKNPNMDHEMFVQQMDITQRVSSSPLSHTFCTAPQVVYASRIHRINQAAFASTHRGRREKRADGQGASSDLHHQHRHDYLPRRGDAAAAYPSALKKRSTSKG